MSAGRATYAEEPMPPAEAGALRRATNDAPQSKRGTCERAGGGLGAPTYLWESYESMASNKLDDDNFSGDKWRGEGAIDGEDGEGRL
jgi:hypothetical protein